MGAGDDARRVAERGLLEGLLELGRKVAATTIGNMPRHDPVDDPDPAVNLAERVSVEPDPGGRSVQVIVRAPHGAKQHEDLRLDHPRGGAGKFMQDALLENVPQADNVVASKVRSQMKPQARLPKSRRT